MSGWLLPAGGAGAERSLEFGLLAHRLLHVGVMMVAMMLPQPRRWCCSTGAWCGSPSAKDSFGTPPHVSLPSPAAISLCGSFQRLRRDRSVGARASGATSSTMALRGRAVAGALLIAAGLYQLTPLKESCLAHCRVAGRVPRRPLARRGRRRLAHGAWPWRLLRGLLLRPDAALVRRRRDELDLDRGAKRAVLLEKLMPEGEHLRVPLGVLMMVAGVALSVGSSSLRLRRRGTRRSKGRRLMLRDALDEEALLSMRSEG